MHHTRKPFAIISEIDDNSLYLSQRTGECRMAHQLWFINDMHEIQSHGLISQLCSQSFINRQWSTCRNIVVSTVLRVCIMIVMVEDKYCTPVIVSEITSFAKWWRRKRKERRRKKAHSRLASHRQTSLISKLEPFPSVPFLFFIFF